MFRSEEKRLSRFLILVACLWTKFVKFNVPVQIFVHFDELNLYTTGIAVRNVYCHTAMGTHVPYGTTQCYMPPGRGDIPTFTLAEAGTRFSDPGGIQG